MGGQELPHPCQVSAPTLSVVLSVGFPSLSFCFGLRRHDAVAGFSGFSRLEALHRTVVAQYATHVDGVRQFTAEAGTWNFDSVATDALYLEGAFQALNPSGAS